MAVIKTAVSLAEPLFNETDALARDLGVSRSRVIALALQEYVERRRNRAVREKLDEVYTDAPDQADIDRLRAMRRHHRLVVERDL